MRNAELVLLRMVAVWTAVGLASGLGYRELTRATEFSGATQLSVVHTHTLVLGTMVGLILLTLERLYVLHSDRRFTWLLLLWNIGLGLTATGLAVKGSLQVLGSAAAGSPALAGLSGTGHIVIAAAFAVLLLVLRARIRADLAERPAVAARAQAEVHS